MQWVRDACNQMTGVPVLQKSAKLSVRFCGHRTSECILQDRIYQW